MFAPSHFSAVLLFATFASVVFGITQRSTPKAMVRYGLYCWTHVRRRGNRGELGDVADQKIARDYLTVRLLAALALLPEHGIEGVRDLKACVPVEGDCTFDWLQSR